MTRTLTPYLTLMLGLASACDPTEADFEPNLDPSEQAGLVLPVIGLDSVEASHVFEFAGPAHGTVTMYANDSLNLGFGVGYPTRLVLEQGPHYSVGCYRPPGEFTWTSAQVDDPSLATVRLDSDRSTSLEILAPGSTRLVLRGRYEHDGSEACAERFDPTYTYEVSVSYDLNVFEPSAAEFRRPVACAQSDLALAVTGAPLQSDAMVRALDRNGQAILLDNAHPRRQVEISVTPPPDGRIVRPADPDHGLDGLAFVGAPGLASITPTVGPAFDLQVVPISAITKVDTEFVVPWGLGKSHLYVEDQGSYNTHGWSHVAPLVRVVTHSVSVGSDPVCSATQDVWFELESQTHAICQVVEAEVDESTGTWWNHMLTASVELVTDGRCGVSLAAPAFDEGRGLRVDVEAEFVPASGR